MHPASSWTLPKEPNTLKRTRTKSVNRRYHQLTRGSGQYIAFAMPYEGQIPTIRADDEFEIPDSAQAFLMSPLKGKDLSSFISLQFSDPDETRWPISVIASSDKTLLEVLKVDPQSRIAMNCLPLNPMPEAPFFQQELAFTNYHSNFGYCLLALSMSVPAACSWVDTSAAPKLQFPPGLSVEGLVQQLDEGQSMFMKQWSVSSKRPHDARTMQHTWNFHIEVPERTMPSKVDESTAKSIPSRVQSFVACRIKRPSKSTMSRKTEADPGDVQSSARDLVLTLEMSVYPTVVDTKLEVEEEACQ